jgi:Tol biopolymer transport system component
LLSVGSRLGPYEVVAPVGVGGMGEVYRARDPRLGRDVALKVLPDEAAANPRRLSRFQREARAVASLNHPHILAVHDIGSEGGVCYVIFELLEGETLRQRLTTGPLPARKVVDYGVQVCRGLSAAHERGVVHRDLKPENLFITAGGHLKILDFGLAKLTGPDADGDPSHVETHTAPTEAGHVMGTAGYMSPEQARGRPADARSDIFAVGAILYEMLSGHRAFPGNTIAETLAAVLHSDPDEIETDGVPQGLEQVVRRCLEKNPDERFQSAHDLGLALEMLSGPTASRPGSGQQRTRDATGLGPTSRLWKRLAAVSLVAVAAGGGYALGRHRAASVEPPAFEQVTFRRGAIFSARFVPPRGDTIVYGAAWQGAPVEVFSTTLGESEARTVGFSPATVLAVSTRGELALSLEPRWVYSDVRPGVLARVPLSGGTPRRLLAEVNAADWDPEGRELAVVRLTSGGSRIDFPPGTTLYETKGIVNGLRVSPDGKRLAFIEHDEGGARVMTLVPGSEPRVLSAGWNGKQGGLAWSPSGREVLFSLARSMEEPAHLHAVDLEGRLRLVLRVPGGVWLEDVSRDGRVLLAHTNFRMQLRAGETEGGVERDLSWHAHSYVTDIAPDGRQVLFLDGPGLYLRAIDGSPAVRLGRDLDPGALSPDGTRVVAMGGDHDRVLIVPTREGETVRLPNGTVKYYDQATWMPDGQHLLLSAEDGGGERVFLQGIGAGAPQPVTPTGFSGACPAPDGVRFVARGPAGSIVVYSLQGAAPRAVPGDHHDRKLLRWSADGRWLFAYRQGDLPGRLYRIDLATGTEEVVRTLMPPDPTAIWRIHPVVVSPDGRHYAYTAIQDLSQLYVYTGLR